VYFLLPSEHVTETQRDFNSYRNWSFKSLSPHYCVIGEREGGGERERGREGERERGREGERERGRECQ
jgi:hypothetical protein